MADQKNTGKQQNEPRESSAGDSRKNVSKGENKDGTYIEQETQNDKKREATQGS